MCPDPPIRHRQLFPPLEGETFTALDGYAKILDRIAPLKPKHRRMLPSAVKSLSSNLTGEREKLKSDYLSAPGPLNAYLRYFLPWNLVRLARLFAGLGPETGLGLGEGSVVADLGAGPLTVVQALWLAAPGLRKTPMTFLCVDRTPKAMRLGLSLFHELAGAGKDGPPWKITLINGSLTERISGGANLLVCANALNEFVRQTRKPEPEQAESLAVSLSQRLRPGGKLLCVEPGVRNASRLLCLLRERLVDDGMRMEAPCPHDGPCPMPGEARTSWCHFPFSVHSAPDWLKDLSREAGLAKVRASLSFLLASREAPALPSGLVRVVSDEFALPGQNARGRYGCSDRGLTLVTLPASGGPMLHPGLLLTPSWPEKPGTDQKSGAVILPLGAAETASRDTGAKPGPKPSKPSPKPSPTPSSKTSPKAPGTEKTSEPARKKSPVKRARPAQGAPIERPRPSTPSKKGKRARKKPQGGKKSG